RLRRLLGAHRSGCARRWVGAGAGGRESGVGVAWVGCGADRRVQRGEAGRRRGVLLRVAVHRLEPGDPAGWAAPERAREA
ncbi:hypothetical protein OEK97_28695, partial [Escherichia coli]|uniref:hypothetical protein n=1 Tax=Escherichia coli TaxID=562 RepID=UPI0021DA77A6